MIYAFMSLTDRIKDSESKSSTRQKYWEEKKNNFIKLKIKSYQRHNLKNNDLWKQYRVDFRWLIENKVQSSKFRTIKRTSCTSSKARSMSYETTRIFNNQITFWNIEKKRHSNILKREKKSSIVSRSSTQTLSIIYAKQTSIAIQRITFDKHNQDLNQKDHHEDHENLLYEIDQSWKNQSFQ